MNARCMKYLAIAALAAAPSFAADDEALRKDLTSVIALQGLPCGKVTAVEQRAERDYNVTCQDGNRYRVYVNAEGRVVVQKQ
jgi:hypothetical protein